MWYCTYVHRLNTLEIAVLVSLNVRDIFIIIYHYIYDSILFDNKKNKVLIYIVNKNWIYYTKWKDIKEHRLHDFHALNVCYIKVSQTGWLKQHKFISSVFLF